VTGHSQNRCGACSNTQSRAAASAIPRQRPLDCHEFLLVLDNAADIIAGWKADARDRQHGSNPVILTRLRVKPRPVLGNVPPDVGSEIKLAGIGQRCGKRSGRWESNPHGRPPPVLENKSFGANADAKCD
jgi:hypothetical protein